MDNPKVSTKRQAAPAWAKPDPGTAAQVAAEALSGERKITPNQRSFLLDLIAKKQVKPDQEGKIDLIMKCLRISEDPEEFGMSLSKASELISWYVKQPDKPREEQQPGQEHIERLAVGVPAGRYAVDGDDGLLKFYKVWISRDKKRLNVYVEFGPSEADLKYQKRTMGVLNKIKAAGIRECAIRYGMEIGACSNCGRRLTNHISRALGIGPICGGRMFGEAEWRDEVKDMRQSLIDQGINPEEEVE